MAKIELNPIKNILDNSFYIPNYQRGYRWGKEQVKDLLDDLGEFYKDRYHKNNNGDEIYCLQPLVVQKNKDSGKWDVIDGQQRLTTVFIILSCLKNEQKRYSIEYQTREKSSAFLNDLGSDEAEQKSAENADYYYMFQAYNAVKGWRETHACDRDAFVRMILDRVNFIWYELDVNEDPIKVFTRLNIGKISLTESELIKALFLNQNNYTPQTTEKEKMLSLVEIANEWDEIEYRLQDDRFWLFFHETEYKCPTRIDFILNMIRIMDNDADGKYNDKTHPTFAYFYDKINSAGSKQKAVTELWKKIYRIYAAIEEWYNDEEAYHYIGYLSVFENKIIEHLNKYQKDDSDKSGFINYLKQAIKNKVKVLADLDFVYEASNQTDKNKSKTEARPILLLHNVQTVIDQNKSISSEKKYNIPDFIRFPFHLFKKEKWDVEHVRPNNLQDFQGDRKKGDILKYIYVLSSSDDQDTITALDEYDRSARDADAFESLWNKINNQTKNNELTDDQKNKIWNFVLLDSSTNREYGNACFSIKRDYVLKKEKGVKPILSVDNKGNVSSSEVSEAAFVPICTRKVFSKEYTQYPDNLRYWTEKDATYYRMDIEKTLWWYLNDDNRSDTFPKEKFDDYVSEIIQKKQFEKSFSVYIKETELHADQDINGGNPNE